VTDIDYGFSRIVRVRPAFHKVHANPRQDYGVGCCEVIFVLRGPLGAISWQVFTGWHLDETWEWWEMRRHTIGDTMFGWPLPVERPKGGVLALHASAYSPEHAYRGPEEACEWLGGPCWSEIISYLAGDKLMPRLITDGDEAVWIELRTLYDRHLAEIA